MIEFTTETLHNKLKNVKIAGSTCSFTASYCDEIVPVINEINKLKKQQNAVILAHAYVTPDIILGVSDFSGDSYGLSLKAQETNADKIIFVAVRFMAETAKILNPSKEVFVPAELDGCSLADSINGEIVKKLREQFPKYTFVCYINTTAEVKAYCDVSVTSSNVYDIVETIPNDKIYFLPDRLMGLNIQEEMRSRGVQKDIQLYNGTCYVHEQYDPEMLDYIRVQGDGKTQILAHPECSPEIIKEADYVGSTTQMIKYVEETDYPSYFVLTECGLIERLQLDVPHKKFVGSCTQCKYMKSNTLKNILQVLKNPLPHQVIEVGATIREQAKKCIDHMFEYTNKIKQRN